jgi:hypothetical protein
MEALTSLLSTVGGGAIAMALAVGAFVLSMLKDFNDITLKGLTVFPITGPTGINNVALGHWQVGLAKFLFSLSMMQLSRQTDKPGLRIFSPYMIEPWFGYFSWAFWYLYDALYSFSKQFPQSGFPIPFVAKEVYNSKPKGTNMYGSLGIGGALYFIVSTSVFLALSIFYFSKVIPELAPISSGLTTGLLWFVGILGPVLTFAHIKSPSAADIQNFSKQWQLPGAPGPTGGVGGSGGTRAAGPTGGTGAAVGPTGGTGASGPVRGTGGTGAMSGGGETNAWSFGPTGTIPSPQHQVGGLALLSEVARQVESEIMTPITQTGGGDGNDDLFAGTFFLGILATLAVAGASLASLRLKEANEV